MPPKPRPHGKKPRTPTPGGSSGGMSRNTVIVLAVAGALALVAIAAAFAFTMGGEETGDARAALEAAGCTLTTADALPGNHSIATPEGTSDEWNTDPPTSGPHYQVPAVWGIYDEPVNQAQLVHNLEHGGIAVQYGDEVPAETVAQLKAFAQENSRGTVLAPYPSLGDQISMGAWVTPDASRPDDGTGYLAKCPRFDQEAFQAFFDAYQFRGPERFPADSLLPGHT